MKWLRSVVAVVLGMLLCVSIVTLIEGIGHRVFPPSPEVLAIVGPISQKQGYDAMAALKEELAKPEVRAAFLAQPFTVYLPPLFAWVVAAMMGSWAAGLIARRRPMAHALIVGGLFLAATLMNLAMLPHPIWVWVATFVLVPGAVYLGGSLADVRLERGMGDSPQRHGEYEEEITEKT
jgi:hypothetical protein